MTAEADQRLAGQVAIVTGGASGIGFATCLALARAGACVVLADLGSARVEQAVAQIEDTAPAAARLGLALDVRSEADMAQMAERTLDRFGRIDMLVAAAAILRAPGTPPKPVLDTSAAEFDQVIETNLKGVFLSNRAVLPAMIRQRSGNILNIASVSGREGRANDAPYCASKFGVIGLSESLAAEVRNYGVRVQILLPDATDTPMWEQNRPVPRPPETIPAERVAETILFLLTLPEDTIIIAPVIAPFRTRRRLGRDRGAAGAGR